MSQKDREKFAKKLDNAENTARIRLFGKASKKYNDLIKTAKSIEPSMVAGLSFFAALYIVNQDISDSKDPILTGSFQRLFNLRESISSSQILPMALPGGFFGEQDTHRVFKECEAILLMDNGINSRDPETLRKAAQIFLEIGSNPLFFSRYTRPLGRRMTGNRAALECEAQSSIIKGDALADAYPNAAIPNYMVATRALRAARRYEEESKLRAKLIGMRLIRRCWFCGRLVQGHNHIVGLDSKVTKYFENLLEQNKEDLRVYEGNTIFACLPCATALSNEADKRARVYYENVMQHINRLQSELNTIKAKIPALFSQSRGG